MRGTLQVTAMLLALSSPALAQETVLLGDRFESGGFGGPVVKFSEALDKFAVFVGGRGGWIINHTFVIGGGGYGLANDIDLDGDPSSGRDIDFGYGGLELEYINRSDRLLHFTLYALVGWGEVTANVADAETVFVFEPAGNVELNVTHYFRALLGLGYRLVTAVDTPGLKGRDLSSVYGAVTFKFGAF